MNIGSVSFLLGANTAGLLRASTAVKRLEEQVIGSNARMQMSFQNLGSKMMLLGATMTQFLTVPMGLLAAVGIKTFASYETQIAKIVALTGTSLNQAKSWSNDILSISKQYGQAPKDVAAAMYFIASPALKASTAMDVLKEATKGAFIGLGDVQVIGKALVNIINAYGESNVTAAHGLDVMITATKNGVIEADQLSAVFGKVLPTAQALGVGIEDLAGSIAALTLTGKTGAEASTQLNRLFSTLIQSRKGGENVLESFGISFKKLRTILRDQGMMATIQELSKMIGGNTLDEIQNTQAFKDNIDVLGDVFTNLRALLPILDMLGPNMKNWGNILDNMTKSTGSSNAAVEVLNNTIDNRFKRILAGAKDSLIKFGDVIKGPLMNLIENFAKWINGLADKFAKLPEATQGMIVSFTLITAALGPLMLILGPLVSMMANFIGFMVGGSLAAGVGWFLLLAAAIYEIYKNWELVKEAFANFDWNSFGGGILAGAGNMAPGLRQGIAMMQAMQDVLVKSYIAWNTYAKTVQGAESSIALISDKTKEYNGLIDQMGASTTLEGRKKIYEDIQKVLVDLEQAYTAVIAADGKTKSSDKDGNLEKALITRRKIVDELDRIAKQKVKDLDVGFGDVGKKFIEDAINGINALQKKITGLDLTKLTKGLGIADVTSRGQKSIKPMLSTWQIPQEPQGLDFKNLFKPAVEFAGLLDEMTTKSEKYQTIVGMMINDTNDALNKNAEVANVLGKNYDKAGEDINILQEAMKNLTGDTMPDMSELLKIITPEQITAIQQYLSLLEQLKAKTGDNVKALTAWKNLFRDIASLAGTIGKYLGEGFQKVFSVIQDIVSGVSQFIAIIRDIAAITKFTSTAATVAQATQTAAVAVSIPVVLGAAAAQETLAVASTNAAVAGAAASTSWIPIVGVGLAIAGVAALLIMLNKSHKSTGMANGGTIPSGFPNDSFPAMLTSGETVIPLTKMAEIFGKGAKTGQQQVVFKIHRKELVGILQDAAVTGRSF